ncbi:hypothetical protein OAS39_11940 [Pirellulales bacterium]|nr:hypothetical protein [Pirellulales bacterium]
MCRSILAAVIVACSIGASISTVTVTAADSLLRADGGRQWYRGNMHTHSHWSDDYLENIALWYRQHGYHFLVLTEACHARSC